MGKAVCVVKYHKGSRASYRLNEDELEKILGDKAVSRKKVALISVAGAFRKGKSFLLNFFVLFLKCLSENPGKEKRKKKFFDETSSLDNFDWRGGPDRHTNGIYLWSEPYILRDSDDEEVAVFLMDTQGTFDHQSTVQDCATIFALSTLLSSVQIFNISCQIQEDDLNNLRLFTEYANLAQQEEGRAPFQKLLFLVRDWANSQKYDYGYEGGEDYLKSVLKTSKDQKKELRKLRESLTKSFTSMEAFLMPHPGLKISQNNSNKTLGEVEPNFAEHMEAFVPSLFEKETLEAKTINGKKITCGALLELFKSYMTIFNSDELPEPKSILNATADAVNVAAMQRAKDSFERSIKKEIPDDLSDSEYFNKTIEVAKERAMKFFDLRPKLGDEEAAEKFKQDLKTYFEDRYLTLKRMIKLNKRREKERQELLEKERQLEEEQMLERERIRAEEERLQREQKEREQKMVEEQERKKKELEEKEKRINQEMKEKEEKIKQEAEKQRQYDKEQIRKMQSIYEQQQRLAEIEREKSEERRRKEREEMEERERRQKREIQEERDRMQRENERQQRELREEAERNRREMEERRRRDDEERERERLRNEREREREREETRRLERERRETEDQPAPAFPLAGFLAAAFRLLLR